MITIEKILAINIMPGPGQAKLCPVQTGMKVGTQIIGIIYSKFF